MEENKLNIEDNFFLPYYQGFIFFSLLALLIHAVENTRIWMTMCNNSKQGKSILCEQEHQLQKPALLRIQKMYTLFQAIPLLFIVFLLTSGPLLLVLGLCINDIAWITLGSQATGSMLFFVGAFYCWKGNNCRYAPSSSPTTSLNVKVERLSSHLSIFCVTAGFVMLAVYCKQMDFVNEYRYFGPMYITGFNLDSHSPSSQSAFYDVNVEMTWDNSCLVRDDDDDSTSWCRESKKNS